MFERPSRAALLGLLLLTGFLCYANALLNGFVFDDHAFVLGNPFLYSFHYWREIISGPILTAVGVHKVSNYYRPLVTLSFLFSHRLFGPVAFGFHLVNLVVHLAIVSVLFFLTERMFRQRAVAFVAAALFAVHPIHTESVSWISGLTDLELTLFILLAFWAYWAAARPGGKTSVGMHMAAVGSLTLALFAKEQALVFPALATLYEHLFRDDRRETNWKQKVLRYGPLWLVGLAYAFLRMQILGSFAPILQRPYVSRWEAFLSGFALLGDYAWKVVFPVKLSVWYGFHESRSLLDVKVLAGSAVLMGCFIVILALRKRAPAVSLGVIWFLVTLSPVLNARVMATSALADRYLYLPSVGFCWILAWGWWTLWERSAVRPALWRPVLATALAAVTVLYVLRSVTRNRDWKTDIALYTSALRVSPDALFMRNCLGLAYWTRGNLQAAEQQWQEALRMAPENPVDLDYLSMLYLRQRRYDEAEKYVQRALTLYPKDPSGHIHSAQISLAKGAVPQAEEHFQAVLTVAPFDVSAHNGLGRIYAQAGRLAEAEQHYRQALSNLPNSESYTGLGDIYWRRGEGEQAADFYRQALAIVPTNSHAHFALGEIYAASGHNAEAIHEYEAGLETDQFNSQARAEVEKLRAR